MARRLRDAADRRSRAQLPSLEMLVRYVRRWEAGADRKAAEARERRDEAPPWLYYHSPGFFDLQRGLAYRYVGQHDPTYNRRAIDALARGLAELPLDLRDSEWAGEFVYQLGRASLQAGEGEQADRMAADLGTLAQQIDSKRLAAQAAALTRR